METSEEMRKLVEEKGREARNLLNWNVPLEEKTTNDGEVFKKPPMSPRSTSSHRKVTEDLRTKARIRSASVGRSPSKGLRTRYWTFLFENLRRAVDEIYRTCEVDESITECKEAIMMLECYSKEFKALIEWVNLNETYENTPALNRPNSLSWEVRKSSPGKAMLWSKFFVKPSPSPQADKKNLISTGMQTIESSDLVPNKDLEQNGFQDNSQLEFDVFPSDESLIDNSNGDLELSNEKHFNDVNPVIEGQKTDIPDETTHMSNTAMKEMDNVDVEKQMSVSSPEMKSINSDLNASPRINGVVVENTMVEVKNLLNGIETLINSSDILTNSIGEDDSKICDTQNEANPKDNKMNLNEKNNEPLLTTVVKVEANKLEKNSLKDESSNKPVQTTAKNESLKLNKVNKLPEPSKSVRKDNEKNKAGSILQKSLSLPKPPFILKNKNSKIIPQSYYRSTVSTSARKQSTACKKLDFVTSNNVIKESKELGSTLSLCSNSSQSYADKVKGSLLSTTTKEKSDFLSTKSKSAIDLIESSKLSNGGTGDNSNKFLKQSRPKKEVDSEGWEMVRGRTRSRYSLTPTTKPSQQEKVKESQTVPNLKKTSLPSQLIQKQVTSPKMSSRVSNTKTTQTKLNNKPTVNGKDPKSQNLKGKESSLIKPTFKTSTNQESTIKKVLKEGNNISVNEEHANAKVDHLNKLNKPRSIDRSSTKENYFEDSEIIMDLMDESQNDANENDLEKFDSKDVSPDASIKTFEEEEEELVSFSP